MECCRIVVTLTHSDIVHCARPQKWASGIKWRDKSGYPAWSAHLSQVSESACQTTSFRHLRHTSFQWEASRFFPPFDITSGFVQWTNMYGYAFIVMIFGMNRKRLRIVEYLYGKPYGTFKEDYVCHRKCALKTKSNFRHFPQEFSYGRQEDICMSYTTFHNIRIYYKKQNVIWFPLNNFCAIHGNICLKYK